jgi:hypothetical protein
MLFGDAKKNVDAILTHLREKEGSTHSEKILVKSS